MNSNHYLKNDLLNSEYKFMKINFFNKNTSYIYNISFNKTYKFTNS